MHLRPKLSAFSSKHVLYIHKTAWISLDPRRTGKIRSFIIIRGSFGSTVYAKGLFLLLTKTIAPFEANDVQGRLVPLACRDHQSYHCTGKVYSSHLLKPVVLSGLPLYGKGLFFPLTKTSSPFRPTTYGKGLFFILTKTIGPFSSTSEKGLFFSLRPSVLSGPRRKGRFVLLAYQDQ